MSLGTLIRLKAEDAFGKALPENGLVLQGSID